MFKMTDEEARARIGATEDGGAAVPMNLDLFLTWNSGPYALDNPEDRRAGVSTSDNTVEDAVRDKLHKHGYFYAAEPDRRRNFPRHSSKRSTGIP
jgi:hypothetical protein